MAQTTPDVPTKVFRSFATDPRLQNPKPAELHTNATIFLRDAEALGSRASAGQYVLVMHAIELGLKAYLHGHGYSLEDLEDIRHDLDQLLARSQAKGLVVTDPGVVSLISALNQAGRKARIRYEFAFEMPGTDDVLRVARVILDVTQPELPPLS